MKGRTPNAALEAMGLKPWTIADEKRLTNLYRQYMAAVLPGGKVLLQVVAQALEPEFPGRSKDAIENKLQRLGLWQRIYRKRKRDEAPGTNGAVATIVNIRAYRCPHCKKLSEIKK